MANAVEKADVVLVAMSHKYKESNNCRTEASYAYKMKKPIIPLLVEDGYDPDGWLGALVGMLLYYKVISKDTLSKQLPLIIKELGNSARIGAAVKHAFQSVTTKTSASTQAATTSADGATHTTKVQLTDDDDDGANLPPCPEWTTEQVQQWLCDNNLNQLKTAMKDYDGKCLVHMGMLAQRCPEYFYNTLRTEFKLDLLSVIRLSCALEKVSQEL
ncbi:uncharacterized protein [Amphiura filiformis]|uniref:uncharacterized protein n=1 Tax=Amphiura filiformis TaxID=82378 RepID=UPI003B21FB09